MEPEVPELSPRRCKFVIAPVDPGQFILDPETHAMLLSSAKEQNNYEHWAQLVTFGDIRHMRVSHYPDGRRFDCVRECLLTGDRMGAMLHEFFCDVPALRLEEAVGFSEIAADKTIRIGRDDMLASSLGYSMQRWERFKAAYIFTGTLQDRTALLRGWLAEGLDESETALQAATISDWIDPDLAGQVADAVKDLTPFELDIYSQRAMALHASLETYDDLYGSNFRVIRIEDESDTDE